MQILVTAPNSVVQYELSELHSLGFALTVSTSLPESLRAVNTQSVDAIVVNAEDKDAATVCEMLRACADTPLIVAGRNLSSSDVRACLELGADAVLPSPVPADELGAWIRAIVRRTQERPRAAKLTVMHLGDIVINLAERRVIRRGEPVHLSRREFELLTVLAEQPGRVVETREILERVWGPEYVDDIQYVRQYIGYLRAKLEDDPAKPRFLATCWGVGYRLVLEATPAAVAV